MFGFYNFIDIKLNNNLIETFNFSNISDSDYLKKLFSFDLSFNKLRFLDSHSFNYLVNINFLNLSNNLFTMIQSNLFSCNHNLKYLNFSYDRIQKINHSAFSYLNQSSLLLLDISNNKLEFIKNYFFIK